MQYKIVLDPKKKYWLTGDLHLGEERFEIMGRPFTSVQEHIDCLIKFHNEIVSKDDLVINVGDVCYHKAPHYLNYVKFFHGEKILIRGNHDRPFSDEQLKAYFVKVIPEGEGLEIEGLGFAAFATHYPSRARVDFFNAVGHIHAAWKVQLNMLNVGVDVNHFRPSNIDRLGFFYKAISDFYDDDVWVAYNSVNQEYLGKRGKPGSYFKEEVK